MKRYQQAYLLLFNVITDALNDLDAQNFGLLRNRPVEGQQQAEQIFLEDAEEEPTEKI